MKTSPCKHTFRFCSSCSQEVCLSRGSPTHVIMWHSEFSISPSHPGYVVFFCLQPPESGGKTGITSSLAVYDRLKKACPRFLKACEEKAYLIRLLITPPETAIRSSAMGCIKNPPMGQLMASISLHCRTRRSGILWKDASMPLQSLEVGLRIQQEIRLCRYGNGGGLIGDGGGMELMSSSVSQGSHIFRT